MKWYTAHVDDGVEDEADTKRDALQLLKAKFDSEIRSHKMIPGLYHYQAKTKDIVGLGFYWRETGWYIVRDDTLKLWNHDMWQAWSVGIDYRTYGNYNMETVGLEE